MMKHTLRTLFVILLVLVFSTAAWAYTDTQDLTETEVAALEAISDMGVMEGYPDGSFRPAAPINRAEFAKVLCQFAAVGELMESAVTFADVPPAAWYAGWVNRAAEQGWITGYPGDEYRPQNTITQQELAAILLRLSGVDTEGFGWPHDFIAAAEDAGLLAELSFDGPAAASRIMAGRMLYNLLPQQPQLEAQPAEQPTEQPTEQSGEQDAEQIADGFYLGVVESITTYRSSGADLKLFEQPVSLPLSGRQVPAAGNFIYYTVKDGKIDSWSMLLDAAKGDVSPTTALTRLVVPDGPYTWASRQTGREVETPPELNSVKPLVQFISYRNLTVGQFREDTYNYWLSDNTLIYEVRDGQVTPGSRDSIGLKQEVTVLADKNDEARYVFCFIK